MITEVEIKHMHQDLEVVKRDIAIIKHALLEEGELTPEAKMRLERARKTPLSEYTQL